MVAIAKLANPKVCLHAGSFIRYREACQHFVVAKLKNQFNERKRKRSEEPVQRQPVQRQPVQRQPVQRQPVQRQPVQQPHYLRRAAARGRRDAFMKKVVEHQRRFDLRHQQIE